MRRSLLRLAPTVFIIATMCGCAQHADEPKLLDLEGQVVLPLADSDHLAKVFIFMRTDCPIGNRYVPELNRICDEFQARNIQFALVYPQPNASADAIRRHLERYALQINALRDPAHELVRWVGASTTPEAAVLTQDHQLVYCGRIDDRYVDFGQARAAPTRQDLREVLSQLCEGNTLEPRRTKAIGCYIEPLRSGE